MKIVALAGGVGGAKLAHGLALALPPDNLIIVVNTGDDFDHLGLHICPDLDTVCYTLAGLANPLTGWGRANETTQMMENLARLGGPSWFNLGDQDLATHLERTRRMANGETLSAITRDFCTAWGIQQQVLPMTDDPAPTWVETEEDGWLPFQEYFVHRQCQPRVKGFQFKGVEQACPAPGVIDAIGNADVVIICPSNPWVSIGPILAITPVNERLREMKDRLVAVSPIVGGQAIKGPAAKMYQELGITPSALAVARHYHSIINGFVMDQIDRDQAEQVSRLGMQVLVVDTIMKTIEDRHRLAQDVLHFCGKLNGR
jgi:LPPG:FO 2-phospho-L-lactate transferase